jgi:hypothetical protein
MPQPKHSTGVTLAGIGLGLATGVLGALVLSIPYAYATFYMPILELKFIGVFVLGLLVGVCAGKGVTAGKTTSPTAYRVVGFLSGLFAVYFAWIFWIFACSKQKLLIVDPMSLYDAGRWLLRLQHWELHGKVVKGPVVALAWIAEAATIAFMAAIVCPSGMRSFIRCPFCHARFRSAAKLRYYEIPENVAEIRDRLRDFDFACLADLTEVNPNDTDSFLTLEISVCPACSSFGLLNLESLELGEVDGAVLSSRQTLIDGLPIPVEKISKLAPTTSPAIAPDNTDRS